MYVKGSLTHKIRGEDPKAPVICQDLLDEMVTLAKTRQGESGHLGASSRHLGGFQGLITGRLLWVQGGLLWAPGGPPGGQGGQHQWGWQAPDGAQGVLHQVPCGGGLQAPPRVHKQGGTSGHVNLNCPHAELTLSGTAWGKIKKFHKQQDYTDAE